MYRRKWIIGFLFVLFMICMTGAVFFFVSDATGRELEEQTPAVTDMTEGIIASEEEEEQIEVTEEPDESEQIEVTEEPDESEQTITEEQRAPQTHDHARIFQMIIYVVALFFSAMIFIIFRRKEDERKL